MERRKNQRLPIAMKAEIYVPGKHKYEGQTRDISFGGVFVTFSPVPEIEEGENAVLSIFLQEQPTELAIRIWSSVTHKQEGGLGFGFININIEDYTHFRQMMVFNSPDSEALQEELREHHGLEVLKDE